MSDREFGGECLVFYSSSQSRLLFLILVVLVVPSSFEYVFAACLGKFLELLGVHTTSTSTSAFPQSWFV